MASEHEFTATLGIVFEHALFVPATFSTLDRLTPGRLSEVRVRA